MISAHRPIPFRAIVRFWDDKSKLSIRIKIITSFLRHTKSRLSSRLPCMRGRGRESGEGDQRERERGGGAEPSCCIFYILLTFVAGTVRSRTRGVSAKSMVVWRQERQGERGGRRRRRRRAPAAGSPVLYFLHGGGCRWLRRHGSVCVPGHLLTREDLVPNLWFHSSPRRTVAHLFPYSRDRLL